MLTKMAITRTLERGKVYVWTDGDDIYVGDSAGKNLRQAPTGIYQRAKGLGDLAEQPSLDYWYWCLGGNVFGAPK